MVQIIPAAKTFGSQFGSQLGAGIGEGFSKAMEISKQKKQLESENAQIKKATGLDLTGIVDPKMRQEAFGNYMKMKSKSDFMKDLFGDEKSPEETNINMGKTDQLNEPKESSENEFPKIEPIEKPVKSGKPYSDEKIAKASLIDAPAAREMRAANDAWTKEQHHKEKQETAQRKEVKESFEGKNGDFINKTYDQLEDSLRRDAILTRMSQLEQGGELSESGVYNALEQLGLKTEWLKNPQNEEYQKLAFDLLGGGSLQADYGSRVLQSEFGISLRRIPTLSLTPEGRAQIRENMQIMLLPAKLKAERLKYYTDKAERTGEPLPNNLRGKILDDIRPQLDEAYDKFKERNGRYQVKQGTIPDDNAIEKYYYLGEENFDKAKKMMIEDGYDVE